MELCRGWAAAAWWCAGLQGWPSCIGLQELSLQCIGRLSDDELAAAAVALPDLRRLEVLGTVNDAYDSPRGLRGSRLAAFGGKFCCGAASTCKGSIWCLGCRRSLALPACRSAAARRWIAMLFGSCKQHFGASMAQALIWCAHQSDHMTNVVDIDTRFDGVWPG
jgi:hypothetical protein